MQYLVELGGRTDGFAMSIPQQPRIWTQDAGADTYSMQ